MILTWLRDLRDLSAALRAGGVTDPRACEEWAAAVDEALAVVEQLDRGALLAALERVRAANSQGGGS